MRAELVVTIFSRLLLASAVFLVFASSAPARAQDDNKPDYEAAKRHYSSGMKAEENKEWTIAAREYGIAYEITKDPVLFFKIATAYDNAGDCESALIYYGRYTREGNPEEKFLEKTKERVEACTAQQGKNTGDHSKTDGNGGQSGGAVDIDDPPMVDPVGPPRFDDGEMPWQRTAAWTSVGLAIAFGTAGAVIGLGASSREEDIENLIDFRDTDTRLPRPYQGATKQMYDEAVDDGAKLEKIALVTLSISGAAAVAAVVFFILDVARDTGEDSNMAIAPVISDDSIGVTAGWRF